MPNKPRQVDPIAAHAELLGRVTIAWNNVQYVVFLIFVKLSGMPVKKAEAIFFTLKADSSQRDITLKVAAVALQTRPALLARFVAIMKKLNALAGERNAATHTMWNLEPSSGTIAPTLDVPRHGALQPDFAKQFKELEATLVQHFSDLVALQRAFPRRPELPGRGGQRTIPPKPTKPRRALVKRG